MPHFLRPVITLLALLILSASLPVHARGLPDFTELAETYSPAVVNISTTVKKTGATGMMPPGLSLPDVPKDSPFYEFFRKFLEQMPEQGPSFEDHSSLGSGFIISRDGYVITNNHVIRDADEIIVRLVDRREFVAEVIGTDERSDLAVLKIEGKDLPRLKLGDSSKLKVGEWVLAIGSPFGFDHSVTAGIVSAKGRSLPNENYVPFIQTDVAINPGNSGGPLFNMDGEVVGVNSQIYSRTGGFMGVSFAVPTNVVESVYRQLRYHGKVSRGWLGVLIQDVTRELAESFGMSRPQGALISQVLPDGPAAEAGLEVGDIIVKFDGQEVVFSADLPPLVGSTEVGKTVSLDIIRDGKSRQLSLKILELPDDDQVIASRSGRDSANTDNRLGLTVKALTEAQRKKLELPEHGVLVEKVDAGPARAAGIRQGDVILLLNNEKVVDVKVFDQLAADLPRNRSVPVLIQRQGGPLFLALRIEE